MKNALWLIVLLFVLLPGGVLAETPVFLEQPMGFAAVEGMTTGGAGGRVVTATNTADLRAYAAAEEPLIIMVSGTMQADGHGVTVSSNKTILGVGADARILGFTMSIHGGNNIIIRNLAFEKCRPDGIEISDASQHIWIDHCDFSSDLRSGVGYYDELLTIKHAADLVTVSWCRFHDHFKTLLIGAADSETEDIGKLRVTLHNNLFDKSAYRNPSVRFGTVHLFNNYFHRLGEGPNARIASQILVENNVFKGVNAPFVSYGGSRRLTSRNNVFSDSGKPARFPKTSFDPAAVYPYTLDDLSTLADTVSDNAGVKDVDLRPGSGAAGAADRAGASQAGEPNTMKWIPFVAFGP